MAEKPTVERGNPVIPDAPVPSMVRMSMVPDPPIPIPKEVDGVLVGADIVPPSTFSDTEIEEKLKEEIDAHP